MKARTLTHARSRGLSIIELLIALAIGSVLVAGAVLVYSQSRNTHTVSDTIARLQENGRYVFSVLEPDIQLAGYYGFTNAPDDLHFMQGGSTGTVLSAFRMQKSAAPVVDSTNPVQACGNNFAFDVVATIEASNNEYKLACKPDVEKETLQAGVDTLTVRRVTNPPADGKGAANARRVQVLLSRLSPSNQFVFADGQLPSETVLAANLVQVRDFIVRSYYISKDATDATAPPSLRMKALTDGPAFGDSVEIMRGVEDLQVQFGIDTADYNGDNVIDAGNDIDGNGIPDVALGIATRYVNPDKVPKGFQVVSVRLWILLRAEQPEVGYKNEQIYKYADRELPVKDNYRRVLLSRTITLRNSRTL